MVGERVRPEHAARDRESPRQPPRRAARARRAAGAPSAPAEQERRRGHRERLPLTQGEPTATTAAGSRARRRHVEQQSPARGAARPTEHGQRPRAATTTRSARTSARCRAGGRGSRRPARSRATCSLLSGPTGCRARSARERRRAVGSKSSPATSDGQREHAATPPRRRRPERDSRPDAGRARSTSGDQAAGTSQTRRRRAQHAEHRRGARPRAGKTGSRGRARRDASGRERREQREGQRAGDLLDPAPELVAEEQRGLAATNAANARSGARARRAARPARRAASASIAARNAMYGWKSQARSVADQRVRRSRAAGRRPIG